MPFGTLEWAYNEYGKKSWRNELKFLLLLKAKTFHFNKGNFCTMKILGKKLLWTKIMLCWSIISLLFYLLHSHPLSPFLSPSLVLPPPPFCVPVYREKGMERGRGETGCRITLGRVEIEGKRLQLT